MAKGDDIEARLVAFAVDVLGLCERLPKNPEGNHIGGQLLRSGTSGAPNYAESRAAESAVDFIHKLGLVLKELNESRVWLEMIKRATSSCRQRSTKFSRIAWHSARSSLRADALRQRMREKCGRADLIIHDPWIMDH